jgi:Swiss Army Knife protein, DSP-PTPase phosphatase domain
MVARVDADTAPVAGSYWVETGRLLAGGYPGARDEAVAVDQIERLLGSGVTLFVDLTEVGEPLAPYAHLLRDAVHERHPIPDMGTVPHARYAETLDRIDCERASGGCVYVHCWGGVGRTGTVIGCWLARHGRDGGNPIARIAELRSSTTDWFVPSPQTPHQTAVVRGWRRGA